MVPNEVEGSQKEDLVTLVGGVRGVIWHCWGSPGTISTSSLDLGVDGTAEFSAVVSSTMTIQQTASAESTSQHTG